MRSIAIIATILAISLAIPAGLLFAGTLSTTQLANPKNEIHQNQSSKYTGSVN